MDEQRPGVLPEYSRGLEHPAETLARFEVWDAPWAANANKPLPTFTFSVKAGDVVRVFLADWDIDFVGTVEWTGKEPCYGEPVVCVVDGNGVKWAIEDYHCSPVGEATHEQANTE